MEIAVLNKRVAGERGRYVGRPSPLGNPYVIGKDGPREEVVARYRVWLLERVGARDPRVCGELNRLWLEAKRAGRLELSCWCSPAACHAGVVREVLLERLGGAGRDQAAPGDGAEGEKGRAA